MISLRKGERHPRSTIDPQYGRIKKVFLAYAHNPDPYEQYIPPYPPEQLTNPDIFVLVSNQQAEHIYKQQNKVQANKQIVRNFANYLRANGVAVFYDQDMECDTSNVLQHFEHQICDSDVVLVIVTYSLKYYMDNDAPNNEGEILLTRHFLHNVMTIKKPEGTQFIPIFLNQPIRRDLIPTAIAGSVCYSIMEPFDCRSGNMYDLYTYLTNQKVSDISHPTSVIKVPPSKRPPFGFTPAIKTEILNPHQQKLYNWLIIQHTPVPEKVLVELPNELGPYWDKLADRLGLSKRNIQDCVNNAESGNKREIVYQILHCWLESKKQFATTAVLAIALHDIQCSHLLYLLS